MNDAFRSAMMHMLTLGIGFRVVDMSSKDGAYYGNMGHEGKCYPTPWRRRYRGRIELI